MLSGRFRSVVLVLAMSASLLAAGCVDAVKDELGDEGLEAQSTGNTALTVSATNASEDLSHLGLVVRGVFFHNASAAPGQGFFNITVQRAHTDLVTEAGAQEVQLAVGDLPEGTYDQIVLRVSTVDVETKADASGSASADGGNESEDEDDSRDDGHDHDHGDEAPAEKSEQRQDVQVPEGAFDLPINVTFNVTRESSTELALELDAGASTDEGAFEPVFSKLVVTQDGEVVDERTDVDVGFREANGVGPTAGPPPVARITVFNETGAKIFESDFLAEDGAFVNSVSDPFDFNETLRVSASDSEAVAKGAAVTEFRWDFGDGNQTDGTNAAHSYQRPGVFKVTLTAIDSNGGRDTQTVHVVVANWTTLEVDAGFEDGEGNWTTETSGPSTMSEWRLEEESGVNGSAGWHAGTPQPVNTLVGYEDLITMRLISPNISIPADWVQAGFLVNVRGTFGEVGICTSSDFTVQYHVFGGNETGEEGGGDEENASGPETTQVATFTSEEPGWVELGGLDALSDAKGKTVQFEFILDTLTCNVSTGEGWFMDELRIGGIASEDFENAHLLEQGGHDGHDHEH